MVGGFGIDKACDIWEGAHSRWGQHSKHLTVLGFQS